MSCSLTSLEHDPEKWEPVFGKRSCSNKEVERDDDSKKNHPARVVPALKRLRHDDGLPLSSRAEELHLRALPEPYVNLSIHTAPDVRPLP